MLRQEKSATSVSELFDLWEKELGQVSGKSKTAEAIRYALTRREALERFLTDAESKLTPISSSAISPKQLRERTVYSPGMKVVDGGGRTWATLATLLQTTKMNNVDPLVLLLRNHSTLCGFKRKVPARPIESTFSSPI